MTFRIDIAGLAPTEVTPLSPVSGATVGGVSGQSSSESSSASLVGEVITGGAHDGVSTAYNSTSRTLAITNTDKGSTAVTSHEGAADPHTQYVKKAGDEMTGPLTMGTGAVLDSPAANTLALITDGEERLRVAPGLVRIGPAAPADPLFRGELEIVDESSATGRVVFYRASGDAQGVGYNGYKSRGTVASPSPPLEGDSLMGNFAAGYTGTSGLPWRSAAALSFVTTQTWNTTRAGCKVAIAVTPNNSLTRNVQFTVFGSGAIGVGPSESTGSAGQVLTSAGAGAPPTWTTVGGAVSDPLRLSNGTAAAPTYSFSASTGSGMSWNPSGWMQFSVGGVERFRISNGAVSFFLPMANSGSTAAAPAVIPSGDSNTGLFYPAADTWAVSTGGTERFRLDGTRPTFTYNGIRVTTARTPASATAAGVQGEICWDANYVYVCVATNTWKRSALSTW